MKKSLILSFFFLMPFFLSNSVRADNWDYYKPSPSSINIDLRQPKTSKHFYITPRIGISYLGTFDPIKNGNLDWLYNFNVGFYLKDFRFDIEYEQHKDIAALKKKSYGDYRNAEQTGMFINTYYDFKNSYATPFVGVGVGRIKIKKEHNNRKSNAMSLSAGVSRAVNQYVVLETLLRGKYAFKKDRKEFDKKSNYYNLELLFGARFCF